MALFREGVGLIMGMRKLFPVTLERGMSGSAVYALQGWLWGNRWGVDGLNINGVFDEKTAESVAGIRRQAGLDPAGGRLDPRLKQRLKEGMVTGVSMIDFDSFMIEDTAVAFSHNGVIIDPEER